MPLSTFIEAEPALPLDQLGVLRTKLDGERAGELFLDEVGLRRAETE